MLCRESRCMVAKGGGDDNAKSERVTRGVAIVFCVDMIILELIY